MTPSNGRPPSHTDRARELLDYADTADEVSEVTENHFHLPKGTTLDADATGKVRAVSVPDVETEPDNEKPSDPPESKRSLIALAFAFVRKFPPWGAVLVALAAIAAYVVLHR